MVELRRDSRIEGATVWYLQPRSFALSPEEPALRGLLRTCVRVVEENWLAGRLPLFCHIAPDL